MIEQVRHRMEQIPEEIIPFADWLVARRPRHVVEIGVRFGGTAELWHKLSTGLVVGVDWAGKDSLGAEGMRSVAESLGSSLPRFRFVEGDSHDLGTLTKVMEILGREPIDFLFLDGDHSFEGVSKDWELYGPLVRKGGGCVAFHDIVDSNLIRAAGHGVYKFWLKLGGRKTEFCVNGEWGGIGVVEI